MVFGNMLALCAGRVLAFVLFISVLISIRGNSSYAESTSSAMKTFGLVGTWSRDCSLTRDVLRTTWAVPMLFGGFPTMTYNYMTKDGDAITQISEIEEALRMTEDKIKLKIVVGKRAGPQPPGRWLPEEGEKWEAVLFKLSGKYRVLSGSTADGKKLSAKDGFVYRQSNGQFERTDGLTSFNEGA
jgi:hypothetical protein